MKRDDQVLALRLQAEENRNRMTKAARDIDRALANSGQNGASADPDVEMEDDGQQEENTETEAAGSKTIVIQPGSQNLRIGLATDPLPRSIPMVIARRSNQSESEEDGGEPQPKRQKLESGELGEESTWFGEDVCIMRSCASYISDHQTVQKRIHRNGCRVQDFPKSQQTPGSSQLARVGLELELTQSTRHYSSAQRYTRNRLDRHLCKARARFWTSSSADPRRLATEIQNETAVAKWTAE